MPKRHGSVDGYRYGFQGQEKDDEIKDVEGSSLNYKYRMHDPRVGRFFAVDPLAASFPHNSSYAFSENRVLDGVELEGSEHIPYQFYEIYIWWKFGRGKKKSKGVSGMEKVLKGSGYTMGIPTRSQFNVHDRKMTQQEKVLVTLDGVSDLVEYVVIDPMENGMEAFGSIPGVDTVTDPLLALYFTQKAASTGDEEDKLSAISYTAGMFIPFASGIAVKLTGKGAVQLLKKSVKYDFKITGRVRDDILNSINNPGLKDSFVNLYRPDGSIGNGGTAAIIIEEGVDGKHWQKGHDRLKQLKELNSSGTLNDDDSKIANQLIEELRNAIETAKKNADN